jgi:hypothetical protein
LLHLVRWLPVQGLLGDADKLNNQNALSDQNRNSLAFEKASSKPDVLPKFRLGTSEVRTKSIETQCESPWQKSWLA